MLLGTRSTAGQQVGVSPFSLQCPGGPAVSLSYPLPTEPNREQLGQAEIGLTQSPLTSITKRSTEDGFGPEKQYLNNANFIFFQRFLFFYNIDLTSWICYLLLFLC